MPEIRPFKAEDLSGVAELVTDSYRVLRGGDTSIAAKALEEIIFENPWKEGNIASLVCENTEGAITGFIGISPRSMTFKGEEITIAIIHNFAVKPIKGSDLIGIRILKTLFDRPYDLIIGDATSNDLKKVWANMNSTIGYLYSTNWNIPLRPIVQQIGVRYFHHKWNSPVLFKTLKPAMIASEYLMGKIMKSPFRYEKPEGYTKRVSVEKLVEYQKKFSTPFSLQPNYTPDTLQWALDMAQHSIWLGELKCIGVYNTKDEIIGWYILFLNPGGNSKVLQMHARDGKDSLVIDHLVWETKKSGSLSVSGRLEPPIMSTLSNRYCYFSPGVWMLLHGKSSEIINAITRGDVFFSKLETDLWIF